MSLNKISNSQNVVALKKINFGNTAEEVKTPSIKLETKPDTLVKSNEPPKIGFFRTITGFLTKEQVTGINETGKLPSNCKFVRTEKGTYEIKPNYFGLTMGTKQLPAGYEVKQTIYGTACVLPKGTEGLFIKK